MEMKNGRLKVIFAMWRLFNIHLNWCDWDGWLWTFNEDYFRQWKTMVWSLSAVITSMVSITKLESKKKKKKGSIIYPLAQGSGKSGFEPSQKADTMKWKQLKEERNMKTQVVGVFVSAERWFWLGCGTMGSTDCGP